jgi:hypothetical protein
MILATVISPSSKGFCGTFAGLRLSGFFSLQHHRLTLSPTRTPIGRAAQTHADQHLATVFISIGGALVSWSSKRQATVSRSSAEAEYRAVANAVADCVWLRQLLGELSCPVSKATVVFCDNVSAVYMSTNPVHHRRTKHIELDIHFVREKVALGELRVVHIPTTQQLADVMTKGLPAASFQSFRSSLCVLPVEDLETAAGC